MLRTFQTNTIRDTIELSDKLWNFTPLEGENVGKQYRLMVPGCWENHVDFVTYRGKGVYTTSFEGAGDVRLVFKGVSHTANVYVDDKFVKTHYNAFTAFDVVVKDLEVGTHTLKVEVDNSFSDESTLHRENDYMTYGGINRAVSLEFLQEAYIKYIHVTPSKKDDVWTANVSVAVENISDSDEDMTVSFVLDGKEYFFDSAKMAKKSVTTINADFTFENVNEWSMDEPNLYLIQAFLEIDEEVIDDLIERIGFRQVTLDGNKILINGKQIRIKGFNRHEDHPHFGCSLPYAAMVKDIEIIKDLNANSVRTSHYPNDEIFLDLCDEFGILVWEEHHARGFEEDVMRLPNFDKQCCDCIEEMIEQHYNHPAIYIWGILNECASHTEFGASCYKKQLELIESLDKSRPTTFASNKRYTDICFEYPTVISNNMYPFWYFDVPLEEILRKSIDYANQNSEKLKPFIVSEIGCGGIYGSRSRTREKWTEEGQLDILEKQIVPILEHDECIGVYIWQFCDVRVTPEWAMKRPRSYNNKGIVDEFRREKLAYDMVKRVFGSYSNYLDD